MEGWQQRAAFVIQFRPETDIPAGVFHGRIEHVSSGHAARFHSLAELLDFITNVLEEVKKREQPGNLDQ